MSSPPPCAAPLPLLRFGCAELMLSELKQSFIFYIFRLNFKLSKWDMDFESFQGFSVGLSFWNEKRYLIRLSVLRKSLM